VGAYGGDGWLAEVSYGLEMDRWSLGGWVDWAPDGTVTEHQIGLRVWGPLHGVIELRYHGYRDELSLALGAEYRAR